MNETMIRMMQLAGQGLSCAQILLTLALEARGEDSPELIRAAAGLADGLGTGRGSCGAWTGGVMALALYAGGNSEELPLMLQELGDWFAERFGASAPGLTCEALTGEAGPAAARRQCGLMVAETHQKTMEILLAHGFDLAG